MSDYLPEKWLILKFEPLNGDIFYKVLGTWGGSYLSGQSWKINSGITSVEMVDDWYEFTGTSGSIYQCHKDRYGAFSFGMSVLSDMMEKVKDECIITIMDENTNWMELKYG